MWPPVDVMYKYLSKVFFFFVVKMILQINCSLLPTGTYHSAPKLPNKPLSPPTAKSSTAKFAVSEYDGQWMRPHNLHR